MRSLPGGLIVPLSGIRQGHSTRPFRTRQITHHVELFVLAGIAKTVVLCIRDRRRAGTRHVHVFMRSRLRVSVDPVTYHDLDRREAEWATP